MNPAFERTRRSLLVFNNYSANLQYVKAFKRFAAKYTAGIFLIGKVETIVTMWDIAAIGIHESDYSHYFVGLKWGGKKWQS